MTRSFFAIAAFSFALSGTAGAMTFTDRTVFYDALDDFTVIDTSSYIGSTTFAIDDDFPGVSFFGPDAVVRSDDLILNGSGFFGSLTPHVGLNFETAINGAGVTTNRFDGGDIEFYSGLNGTGTLIGEADFGDSLVPFGGGIFDAEIRSVIFTCEFNFDLRCGLRDIAWGVKAFDTNSAPVPLPAGGALLTGAVALLAGLRRRARA